MMNPLLQRGLVDGQLIRDPRFSIHEAGHITVALVHGCPVLSAYILESSGIKSGSSCFGKTEIGFPKSLPRKESLSILLGGIAAQLLSRQAGLEELLKTDGRHDYKEAVKMSSERLVDKAFPMACAIVGANQRVCRELSYQLLERGRLEEADIKAIVAGVPGGLVKSR